jgi:hypothetical protein
MAQRSRPRKEKGAAREVAEARGARRVRIAAIDERGQVFLIVAGVPRPILATLASGIYGDRVRRALDAQEEAIVVFEDGDLQRPIVLGFVAPQGRFDREPVPSLIADADGSRVRLVARDEIVLECGKASITMRRNGKVIVRGTHVETNSEGTNRIKGGQVKIN